MLTSKQLLFCKQIANGKNATEAYQLAFKTKNKATCKSNGSKLLKSKDIKSKVAELQSLAKEIVKESQKDAIADITLKEVMDVNERMSILTQIARGEIKLKKPMVISLGNGGGSKIDTIEVVPDYMDRKNAIAELNKMTDGYTPERTEHTITGKVPSWLKPM